MQSEIYQAKELTRETQIERRHIRALCVLSSLGISVVNSQIRGPTTLFSAPEGVQ